MNSKTQNTATGFQKKKSVWAKVGMVILVLFLLPFILAGSLYVYLMAADFEYDIPQQVLAQNVPMSFSERNSFDAAKRTRAMLLDNADLYDLSAEIMPDLHFNESVYIKAYRFALEDKAVYVQGQAYGINIPVKLSLDVGYEKGSIFIHVQNAYLGKLCLPIPLRFIAGKLGISLDYALSLEDNIILGSAEDFAIENGFLKVTFPVDKSIALEGINAWTYFKPAILYLEKEDDMVMLMDDLVRNWSEDNYISKRLDAFLQVFQQNPEAYQQFKVKLLAAAPQEATKAFFSSEKSKIDKISRFYPGITPEAVEKMRQQMPYERNYLFLRNFAFKIDEQFGSKAITIKNRKFIKTGTGAVLDLMTLCDNAPEAKEVFAKGTEFCAILCIGADSKQKIANSIYSCGTAFKFVNRRCAVICKKNDQFHLAEITLQEYDDLASGKKSFFVVEIKDRK